MTTPAEYGLALPLFQRIQHSLGQANTLQSIALLDSREGENEAAVRGFHEAAALHQQIEDRLGLRADWGYLGQHYLRNGQPREAALALDASVNALSRESDPPGYALALQLQLDTFTELEDVLGMLACLRLLADAGAGLEEPYANLLAALKEQAQDTDLSDLEAALSSDPEAVRRAAVARLATSAEVPPGEA